MSRVVRSPRWRGAHAPHALIWALSAVLLVLAAALWGGVAIHLGPVAGAAVHVPWWALAVFFFAVERWPVPVLLRSTTFNIGLTEVPLVIGLFFSTPWEVGLGFILGMLGAALTGLGARLVRTAFNLAQSALFIGVAAIAFHAIGPTGPLPESGWAAAYVAAFAINLSCVTTLLAIWLAERKLSAMAAEQTVGLSLMGAAVNGSFGLLGAVLVAVDPRLMLLTLLPISALVFLYHSWITERRRREAVEFLRGADNAFATSPELEAAILAILTSARRAFRATIAQLTIFPSKPEEQAFRTTVREGHIDEVMVPMALRDVDDLLEAESDGIIVEAHKSVVMTEQMLRARGVDDAMVALLQGHDRIVGALLVGGHTAAYVESFDDGDLRLFRTLAVQTAAVLEKGHVETAVASLTNLQEKLAHQAFHDALTGLPNRALFGERVTQALGRVGEEGSGVVALLLVNIDDFATINETLGHAVGDDLLSETARRIAGCLRQPDMAARWGGDEFSILLEDLQDAEEAEIVARRVLAALKDRISIGTDTVRLRASVGIAISGGTPLGTDDLLRRVDIAMNAAKAAGKNCTVAYVEGMELATVTRHQVRSELEQAIERDQLAIHYQPLVELSTGRILGTEALLRWWHPERGLIGPADFIPIAEESGLIVAIGSFVLREACRQTRRWQRHYADSSDIYVSVNVSTRQLQQPLFVEEVMNCLHDIDYDPSRLVLELTESMLLDHGSPLLGKLEALRRHGVRIAIDDFGTGYSSLSYLRNLPIDILKIAKPFVDDLAGSNANPDFARAIVALGQSLKLTLVAEGIEEVSQLVQLQDMGCEFGQGYLLSHPVGQGEIDKLLVAGGRIAGFDEGGGEERVVQLHRGPS